MEGVQLAYTTMEGQLFSTAEDVAVWRMGTVQQTYIELMERALEIA